MLVKARIKTGKRENSISMGDVWEIHLKSRPVKGKANNELVKYLKSLGYDARIVSGFSSRTKILEVTPMGKE